MFSVIKDEIKEEMCLVTTVNDEDVDGNPLVLKETLMSCIQNERPLNSTNLVRSINSGMYILGSRKLRKFCVPMAFIFNF